MLEPYVYSVKNISSASIYILPISPEITNTLCIFPGPSKFNYINSQHRFFHLTDIFSKKIKSNNKIKREILNTKIMMMALD